MKKILTTLLVVYFSSSVYSQDKLPNFGKIDKADLEMTSCSFDPDASSMYLIDRGEVNYNFTNGGVYLQTDIRQRIKILKEDGISRADIKFDYYSKDRYEEISNLEGFVYNEDASGNIVATKLEKSAFYNKSIDDKYSEIAIAFPQVKVGSVIEYKYRSYKKNNIADIKDWMFQGAIPCRYSEYSIYIPEYFEFTYQATHRQPLEYKAPTESTPCHFYAMRNLPALKQEPYMNGYKDYVQKIEFQLSTVTYPNGDKKSFRSTWEKLTEELMEDENFGLAIRKNVPHIEDLQAELRLINDTLGRMKAIYKYLQKNMEWNGNARVYTIEGIKKAWEKKSGSTADINLLLLNLLKEGGIKAYPLLVSTKDNGRLNKNYPFLGQFNEVMVYTLINGQPYYLNAADKINPCHLIPYDVQMTSGFIVDKNIGGWKNMTDASQKFRQTVNLLANMDSSGHFAGEAYVGSYGYARNIRLDSYNKGKINSAFSTNTIEPDSVEVKNVDFDSLPLEQKAAFHGVVEKSGDYFFLPYNLFLGIADKTPFTADKRVSNVDFNYLQQYSISGSYTIPNGFLFDALPKNMALIMPDTSIILKRFVQKSDDNLVSFRITIDFNRPSYDADEYPDLKEFYKKMYAVLNEKIIVKIK